MTIISDDANGLLLYSSPLYQSFCEQYAAMYICITEHFTLTKE